MSITLTFFILLNFLSCIENRICSGPHGARCCYGFALNNLSGKCEKCLIGYHGVNCSLKCSPPTYGDGCQSICNCTDDDCDFAHGCYKQSEASQEQQKQTTNHFIAEALSTDIDQLGDTTLSNVPTNSDLLKNNIVIGFIGVFAFSFAIFVLSYICFKCWQKTANPTEQNENKRQAQYKSMTLEAVILEDTYREIEESVDIEPAYLSPIV